MILYCHDEQGVYIGPVSPAISPARPFVGGRPNYLRPRRSTELPPPAAGPGQVPVFDGRAWSLVEDHRGRTVYDTATRRAGAVVNLGPLPEGVTDQAPPSDCHVWRDGAWVEDRDLLLAKVRAERDARLTRCDWTQLADVPLSAQLRQAWAAYRQALRDHPADWTPDKPWPQAPAE